ncbi:MAG: carbohydrate kinase family protein [Ignavibacteriaceae bacterium]
MKLLIIGHTVEDHIHYQGENKIKPGGIFYTVLTLLNFKNENDEIFLNTSIQKENYHLFSPVFDQLDRRYFTFVERIPKVFLTVHNFKERGETYENITEKLEILSADLSQFDGILINMITGFDLTLDQLKEIRENYTGLIYFDVHTLSRGMDENFHREFRVIPYFREWATLLDIIQVNENELNALFDIPDEMDIAREVLNCGAKFFIVTKGEAGSKIYSLNNDELTSTFISSIKIKIKNKIGCGDAFGAVFFYAYIQSENFIKALTLANISAGCVVSYDDIYEYKNLRKDVFTRYN